MFFQRFFEKLGNKKKHGLMYITSESAKTLSLNEKIAEPTMLIRKNEDGVEVLRPNGMNFTDYYNYLEKKEDIAIKKSLSSQEETWDIYKEFIPELTKVHIFTKLLEEKNWYSKLLECSKKDCNNNPCDFDEMEVFIKTNHLSTKNKNDAKYAYVYSQKITIFYFALASFEYQYNKAASLDEKTKLQSKFKEDLNKILNIAGYSLCNQYPDQLIEHLMKRNIYDWCRFAECCENLNKEFVLKGLPKIKIPSFAKKWKKTDKEKKARIQWEKSRYHT
jgi:hypothetical protein